MKPNYLKTKKIIIKYPENMSEAKAMAYVDEVIRMGRISVSHKHKIQHFCWCSRFTNGVCVYVNQKRKESDPDSFVISND